MGYIFMTCRLRYNSGDITGEPSPRERELRIGLQ